MANQDYVTTWQVSAVVLGKGAVHGKKRAGRNRPAVAAC